MSDDAQYLIEALERFQPLRDPTLRTAIRALHLPAGSRGLDIGCGTGLLSILLAEATYPGGQIVGLDISRPVLAYGLRKLAQSPRAECISFNQGDMRRLPYADEAFDWAWSVDCVGYPTGDLLPVLKEIRRVVRPGGSVSLLAWTSQQILPGHAMLEARLNATCSSYAPFLEGAPPLSHFHRALHWYAEAGLVSATCTTFLGEVQSPLTPEARVALILLFDMLWGQPSPTASEADIEAYRGLCSPESPDCILDVPGYYAFFTYTMFTGQVAR
jgi:demethylmenaquinone methyltransferase/2-methoxy-6-polyprenyl-1,4-benzoquinol methylase